MAIPLLRRPFTVAEYHRIAEAGILTEDDRVELLDGEIVQMTPIGSRHAACVKRLNRIISSWDGSRDERRSVCGIRSPEPTVRTPT